jgi:hypothetical protein
MNFLALGDYFLGKKEHTKLAEISDWRTQFRLD